jgi:hypothetical protein
MAYHVFGSMYDKVLTIAHYDKQFKDSVIAENGVLHVKFKDFLVDNAQAN